MHNTPLFEVCRIHTLHLFSTILLSSFPQPVQITKETFFNSYFYVIRYI